MWFVEVTHNFSFSYSTSVCIKEEVPVKDVNESYCIILTIFSSQPLI